MGTYAYINENYIVEKVIKARFNFMVKKYGIESLSSIPGWRKTSYNTRNGVHYKPSDKKNNSHKEVSDTPQKSLRKNYAGKGYMYDPLLDAFIRPKPYPSWYLDGYTADWLAPSRKQVSWFKENNYIVEWDEDILTWVNLETAEIWDDKNNMWVER